MPSVGVGSYYRTVCMRAWRDTAAFLKAQILFNLIVALIVAVVTYWISADIGEPFNVKVAAYAAFLAALVVIAGAFLWNVIEAQWRMYQELLVRLQAFERRPDVGRLVELREEGIQLLHRDVPIVERAHNDLSDQDVSAHLAVDNQELLTYQMFRRQWEEATAAELEKCATTSELSSFRVIGREVVAFKELLGITAREFRGVTVVLDQEKTMLSERLERLHAIIRRVEGIG
jgi:hypothetical protein